jgi:DNA-binding PadR family transcriptional regulator
MTKQETLSPAALHILLALALKPRHGYEIMQQVSDDSLGQLRIGPATLYTTIKQLLDRKLIEETDMQDKDDPRRRYYRLTPDGSAALSAETARLEHTARLARQRQSNMAGQFDLGLGF